MFYSLDKIILTQKLIKRKEEIKLNMSVLILKYLKIKVCRTIQIKPIINTVNNGINDI